MTAAPQLMFPDASDHFFVFGFGGRDVERPRAQCCGAFFGVPALSGACAAGDHNNVFTHESSALTMRRSLLPGLRSTPEIRLIQLPKVARTPSKKLSGGARKPSVCWYFLLNKF